MTIKIKYEPDIELTREEFERLRTDYNNAMRGYCGYMSFETYVRNQINKTTPKEGA